MFDFTHRSPGVASLVLGEAEKEASNAWWGKKVVCEVWCVMWNTWVVSVWLHADIFWCRVFSFAEGFDMFFVCAEAFPRGDVMYFLQMR